ncbi:DMT family transporter [Rhodovibrionaceae bacterium A322]
MTAADGTPPAPFIKLEENNRLGATWMVGAAVGFTVVSVLAKLLAVGGISVFQLGFARSFFALLPLLPVLVIGGRATFRTDHPWTHLLRACCGAGAMTSGFYALSYLPLATVTVLGFTAPLFAVVMAAIFLKEGIRWRRWLATLVGFAGVVITVRPQELISAEFWQGQDQVIVPLAAALGSAFLIACAVTLVKRFPKGESEVSMLLYFCFASVLINAPLAIVDWRAPTLQEWALMAGVGLVGLASQSMVIKAYRNAAVSFVAPFDYLKLPMAAVLGFLFFAERPELETYLGAVVIIGSAFYIARREAKLRQKAPPR